MYYENLKSHEVVTGYSLERNARDAGTDFEAFTAANGWIEFEEAE